MNMVHLLRLYRWIVYSGCLKLAEVLSKVAALMTRKEGGSVFSESVALCVLDWRLANLRQDFFLQDRAYDVFFLKTKIAIVTSKGFEIMDPTETE